MLKTHNCGDLRLSQAGEQVTLAGWAHNWRDHGSLIFIDLRDRSGLVQVTASESAGDAFAVARKVRGEYVLKVNGTVKSSLTAEISGREKGPGEKRPVLRPVHEQH